MARLGHNRRRRSAGRECLQVAKIPSQSLPLSWCRRIGPGPEVRRSIDSKTVPRRKSTHVDDPLEVGRRLREARERAGLSQRQLSFPGCSPAYISRIEAGDRIPSLQLLREMGRRLGVSVFNLAAATERSDEAATLVQAELAL